MIDTHTHLYSEQFDADREASIVSAIAHGVKQFIVPNIDQSTFAPMMEVCNGYPSTCFPCIGLHPTSVDENVQSAIDFVGQQIGQHNFVAVGEIGIDCYWSVEHIEQQRWAFEHQVKLAIKHGLPIIIHARESFSEIFTLLDKLHTKHCRGVFHSFTGSVDDYNRIRAYESFKIGLGGVLTFKKSHLPEVVQHIRLSDIVLETDAPYLAPTPFRGKRNESAHLVLIAQKLAEIKRISVHQVAAATTANAEDLFKLVGDS